MTKILFRIKHAAVSHNNIKYHQTELRQACKDTRRILPEELLLSLV